MAPRAKLPVSCQLKRVVGTNAGRLARGRLQVDYASAGIQQVYEPAHGYAADNALYGEFERGRLDLRRHLVEVFAREHWQPGA